MTPRYSMTKFRAMWLANATDAEIAAATGMSPLSVYRVGKRDGLPMRSRSKPKPIDMDEFRDLYYAPCEGRSIMKHFKIGHGRYLRIVARLEPRHTTGRKRFLTVAEFKALPPKPKLVFRSYRRVA
jgi:hypothetical protein